MDRDIDIEVDRTDLAKMPNLRGISGQLNFENRIGQIDGNVKGTLDLGFEDLF